MAYGYIAKLSENVERRHVRLNNRFGIAIVGDLYTAKGLDVSKKYPALAAEKILFPITSGCFDLLRKVLLLR